MGFSSMETLSPSSASIDGSRGASSSFDELSMRQGLLFSDSLKDLRNLRSQLYSAAEYFELSYSNDEQNQIVVGTLKDYTVKALVNAVDHLGSVSYKVNDFLDEKVDEVSGTELRVSSIEQRLRTCQESIDLEGLSQQSLVISTPKYHKRYILPGGESMPGSGRQAVAQCQEIDLPMEDRESHSFRAARSTIKDRAPACRRFRPPSPSPRARSTSPRKVRSPSPSSQPGKFLSSEGRAGSPIPTSNPNPFVRYGSLSRRSAVLNSSNNVHEFPAEKPRKSASARLHTERDDKKDAQQNLSKSKRLLKALLSRRKSRRDDMLYLYLDEY